MTVTQDSLRELFFTQSLDGFLIMMIDEPVEWSDTCDKDAVLEYVFHHQRVTIANEAFARHYQRPLWQMIGMTPADFFAHDIEAGKAAWRAMFDQGHLHVETEERRKDGTPLRIEGHYMCVCDERRRITGHLGIQRDITDRYLAAAEISRSREELRALSAHLESVREDERTRIARELHDELGQALTGVKLDVAWLGRRLRRHVSSEVAGRYRSLLERLDEVMVSVQRIVTELRPSVLDHLGLPDAVEWVSHEFAARTGLELDLIIDVNGGSTPDSVASSVFRMLQEALTNVARHAGARHLTVALRQNATFLSLEVSDDGRGITVGEVSGPRSLGLIGLRERARACGGTLEIRGLPGQGTTVSLHLPLSALALA
ncbi:MAG TPA: ATP-binding protein [Gemmatimonadaceae bacterium]|nr:ATP-binding protein [Gemmatimonadaceae bacterium]